MVVYADGRQHSPNRVSNRVSTSPPARGRLSAPQDRPLSRRHPLTQPWRIPNVQRQELLCDPKAGQPVTMSTSPRRRWKSSRLRV
jgi:hypothetical protein